MDQANCTNIRDYLWHNQSDLSLAPISIASFSVVYTLFITLGVVGNLLVIVSVCKHRSLQSVRNIFIVSLSCSDIVVCVVSGSVTPITAFSKIWLFGSTLCNLVPLIQGTSLCFSTLTLTAISIDRFILIIFPTKRPIQKEHAFKMVAFNCAVATGVSFPMFLKQTLTSYGDFCGQFCSEDWGDDLYMRSVYGTVVFVLQFVVPFLIICFCYTMISLKLGKGMLLKEMKKGEEAMLMTEQRKTALRRRMRTNRMLVGMVCVFFCCWLPSVAFNILRDYSLLPQFVREQDYLFGVITHCISISSTVWNPCLYALMNEQFRVAFASLLSSLKGEQQKSRDCGRLMSTAQLLEGKKNENKRFRMPPPSQL